MDGGIGTRGPGESQIETDRRLARDRIAALRRRLPPHEGHARHDARRSASAPACRRVALAGYTNAGKSTLLNALTGADVGVRERLFHTLDPATRSFEISGRTYLLTDTVGFIRKLPHQLVEAFSATLEEALGADLIVHVADASVPEEELHEMLAAVDEVLDETGAGDRPQAAGAEQGGPRGRGAPPRAVLPLSAAPCRCRRRRGRASTRSARRWRRTSCAPSADGAARALLGGRQPLRAARAGGRAGARGHPGRRGRQGPRAGRRRSSASSASRSTAARRDPALPAPRRRRRARPRAPTRATPASTCMPWSRPRSSPGDAGERGHGDRGGHPGRPCGPRGARARGSRARHGISLVNAPGPDRRGISRRAARAAPERRPRRALRGRSGRPDRPARARARWRAPELEEVAELDETAPRRGRFRVQRALKPLQSAIAAKCLPSGRSGLWTNCRYGTA